MQGYTMQVWLYSSSPDRISYTIVCSCPEDGLRCRQGVKSPLNLKTYTEGMVVRSVGMVVRAVGMVVRTVGMGVCVHIPLFTNIRVYIKALCVCVGGALEISGMLYGHNIYLVT